jgi:hypothetical protein
MAAGGFPPDPHVLVRTISGINYSEAHLAFSFLEVTNRKEFVDTSYRTCYKLAVTQANRLGASRSSDL